MKVTTIQLGSAHDVAIRLDRERIIPLYPPGTRLRVEDPDTGGTLDEVRVVGFDVARATLDVVSYKAPPSVEDMYYRAKVAERREAAHRGWFGERP